MSDITKESQAAAVEKIRKLLALAADPSAEGAEAENASRMAARMMVKFNIEESMLRGDKVGTIRCGFAYARHMTPSLKRAPVFAQFIAVGVADYLGCIATMVNRVSVATGNTETVFKFAGEVSDVKFAVWMCETLCLQCHREFAAYKGDEPKVAWQNGWGGAVQKRLREMLRVKQQEEQALKASDSTALIVIDKKVAVVTEKFGESEYRQNNSVKSIDGWRAGMNTTIPTGALESAKSSPALTA